MPYDFAADLDAVQGIAAVPTILDVVCRTTGMGFAAVARVTQDRWIACGVLDTIRFGLQPGGELDVATTICNEIRQSQRAVVIDDVDADEVFRTHPTPALYGFKSYISMPIVQADGRLFGTLCAIDPRPARLNSPEIIGMFKLFAELIAFQLDAHDRLAASAASLADAHNTSRLREHFIAVLGHDLRNPLAALGGAVRLLQKRPPEDKARTLLAMAEQSVNRMAKLIDDVMDLARGRLGGGLVANRRPTGLRPVFNQVIDEFRASHPGQALEAQFDLEHSVDCDPGRLAQLLSNLIANAMTHGGGDAPVKVSATENGCGLALLVSNRGAPIPPSTLERLFEPFERGQGPHAPQGLGLGLYIASQIARAHGGTLQVTSTDEETCFAFRMPPA
jgi:signal transduction histidine kinase